MSYWISIHMRKINRKVLEPLDALCLANPFYAGSSIILKSKSSSHFTQTDKERDGLFIVPVVASKNYKINHLEVYNHCRKIVSCTWIKYFLDQ